MASNNNNELISRASLHTQKKFELIENTSCRGHKN